MHYRLTERCGRGRIETLAIDESFCLNGMSKCIEHLYPLTRPKSETTFKAFLFRLHHEHEGASQAARTAWTYNLHTIKEPSPIFLLASRDGILYCRRGTLAWRLQALIKPWLRSMIDILGVYGHPRGRDNPARMPFKTVTLIRIRLPYSYGLLR